MPNPNKDKGTRWERQAKELLNERFPGTWNRIVGSGSVGSIMGIPALKGDLYGIYEFFPKRFLAECKVGYGGQQMTVKKEWFDKVKKEAQETFSLPVVLLKFDYSRSGTRYIICMDFDVWNLIMEELEDCQATLKRWQITGSKMTYGGTE
jgi:hypothetical protein